MFEMKIKINTFLLITCLILTTIRAQEFYNKNQIIKPIIYVYSVGDTIIINFKKEKLITTVDGKEYLVTLHGNESEYTPFVVAIYIKKNDKYQEILKTDPADIIYYSLPEYFKMKPMNSNKLVEFIHFTEIVYGTGHFITEKIYQILSSGEIKEVLFIPAPKSFKNLKKGEGIWKGEENLFSDKELSFIFWIWNDGDANCCPSAGEVSGNYILNKINNKKYDYEIIMDSFHRIDYSKK
jgi:hypothetical protein